jgi:hypothetical protein
LIVFRVIVDLDTEYVFHLCHAACYIDQQPIGVGRRDLQPVLLEKIDDGFVIALGRSKLIRKLCRG